jgi:hypothetical protein
MKKKKKDEDSSIKKEKRLQYENIEPPVGSVGLEP